MMELCGPGSFTRPISHKLFVGFRPLIVRIDTLFPSFLQFVEL